MVVAVEVGTRLFSHSKNSFATASQQHNNNTIPNLEFFFQIGVFRWGLYQAPRLNSRGSHRVDGVGAPSHDMQKIRRIDQIGIEAMTARTLQDVRSVEVRSARRASSPEELTRSANFCGGRDCDDVLG